MREMIFGVCAALVLGGATFAAPASMSGPIAGPNLQKMPIGPSCVQGFAYSVKEQFGNPVTGHLWFICRADVACPGVMSASTQGSPTNFRFTYGCALPPPAALTACATGFTKGSISLAANIPGCLTPMISCPANFMAMIHTATLAADKHSARFEYQCYRPGV